MIHLESLGVYFFGIIFNFWKLVDVFIHIDKEIMCVCSPLFLIAIWRLSEWRIVSPFFPFRHRLVYLAGVHPSVCTHATRTYACPDDII